MNIFSRKRFLKYIGLALCSLLVISYLGLQPSVTQAQTAYTFSTNYATPASTLDFRQLGYTYDTLPSVGSGLRVRKDATTMTQAEINAFINAFNTLKNTNITTALGQSIKLTDRVIAAHAGVLDVQGRPNPINGAAMINPAHGGAAFLPWHRQYVYEMERLLRTIDPNVTIPYWDWADRTATTNILFQNNWVGPSRGGSLSSGPFTLANGWGVRADLMGRWSGINPQISAIQRSAAPDSSLGTEANYNTALASTTYLTLQNTLQRGTGLHGPTHLWVRGTMGNLTASPSDPLFWMLHANIDRLWAQWQVGRPSWPNNIAADYPATGQSYGQNLNDPMWPWDRGAVRAAADLQDLVLPLPATTAAANGVLFAANSMPDQPNVTVATSVLNKTASKETRRFAKTPEELLNDRTGQLYNPQFGLDAHQLCSCIATSEHGAHHASGIGPNEHLPLDIDDAHLCETLIAQMDASRG